MKHIMIEGFCEYDKPPKKYACSENKGKMGFYCLECSKFSWTDAPYELAYTNKDGVVEEIDDMIALSDEYSHKSDIWRDICRKKIKEAWEEFNEITGEE